MRKMVYIAYEYVYDNFKIYEFPYDSVWTYVFMLLFVDMMYYWNHRCAHEINLFWAAHSTHHSSEEYNLTTATRQSMFLKYTNWMFYLPLAPFVRPSIYMVHSHLNFVYQFWIHTQVIKSVGPLEHVLNTPSHHRVHHGRNPYCIDKNYAGVLIIWDRIFGTFAWEKPEKEEKLAYGLVHPIQTFDPIYIQLSSYHYIAKRVWESTSWNERFSVVFKGPGWVPGSGRLGNHEDLPEVVHPVQKFEVKISPVLNAYVAVNFIAILFLYAGFLKQLSFFPTPILAIFVMMIIYTLTCFGKFFDGKKNAVFMDLIRTAIFVAISFQYSSDIKLTLYNNDMLTMVFQALNVASFAFMMLLSTTSLLYSDYNVVKGENIAKTIKTE